MAWLFWWLGNRRAGVKCFDSGFVEGTVQPSSLRDFTLEMFPGDFPASPLHGPRISWTHWDLPHRDSHWRFHWLHHKETSADGRHFHGPNHRRTTCLSGCTMNYGKCLLSTASCKMWDRSFVGIFLTNSCVIHNSKWPRLTWPTRGNMKRKK